MVTPPGLGWLPGVEELLLSTAPPAPAAPARPHPTVRGIRESLPGPRLAAFDAELADTEADALPALLHRWAALAADGAGE